MVTQSAPGSLGERRQLSSTCLRPKMTPWEFSEFGHTDIIKKRLIKLGSKVS